MPIVTLKSPFASFRGKASSPTGLTSLVAYPDGSAHFARKWVEPSNPRSLHQLAIRWCLATISTAFSTISSSRADAWRAAAVGVIRENAAGQHYELTGPSLYSLLNMYRLMHNQSLLYDPVPLTPPGNITSITNVTVAGGSVGITATHTLGASDNVYIRLTTALPGEACFARPSGYRTITNQFADSIVKYGASPKQWILPMEYFTIAVNDWIGVEILPLGPTYYPGRPVRDPSIVVYGP